MTLARMRKYGVGLTTATLLILHAPVWAVDAQLHGFFVQSVLHSEGNRAFGEDDTPSLEFYEAGLFGTVQFTPRLLGSAQAFVAEAGSTESGDIRLDYALIDYQPFAAPEATFGLRFGRVKNPFGLHNETRDVIFLRPGILLPQSVYLDRQGVRDLLFSSDGGQLYGSFAAGNRIVSWILGAAIDREASKQLKRNLGGGQFPVGDVEITDFGVARVIVDWPGLSLRTGASYLTATLDATIQGVGQIELDSDIWALSTQLNRASFSLTFEYSLVTARVRGFGPDDQSRSDGAYVQADWFVRPNWTVYSRYDVFYVDRNDRDGRRSQEATGESRHAGYARDATLGANWRPWPRWGFWAEGHFIEGTASASGDAAADRNWQIFMLSAAFQF